MAIVEFKCQVSGTLLAQLLDHTRSRALSTWLTMRRRDLEARDEPLEANPLHIRKPYTRRELIGSVGRKIEVGQSKTDQWPRHVHGACRYVDIDEHAADSRSQRLKISTPKLNSSPNVPHLTVCEEGSKIEGVS